MASNLALFPFNIRANTAVSKDGWYVNPGVDVNALAGNDRIIGISKRDTYLGFSIGDGIKVVGKIDTGTGGDIITGKTGSGNGIYLIGGRILTGDGNDKIIGSASIMGRGIQCTYSIIDTGLGNDVIEGVGRGYGSGIDNNGSILTGEGNDRITGIAQGSGSSAGIYNRGMIDTGNGDDIVDAIIGGFKGNGTIKLGNGNDVLRGFGGIGTGMYSEEALFGGDGIDAIELGEGVYTVYNNAIRTSVINGALTMYAFEFERIGGTKGDLFVFGNGQLTIDLRGYSSFIAF